MEPTLESSITLEASKQSRLSHEGDMAVVWRFHHVGWSRANCHFESHGVQNLLDYPVFDWAMPDMLAGKGAIAIGCFSNIYNLI